MIDCITLTEVALFQMEKLLLAEPAKVRVDYGKEKIESQVQKLSVENDEKRGKNSRRNSCRPTPMGSSV